MRIVRVVDALAVSAGSCASLSARNGSASALKVRIRAHELDRRSTPRRFHQPLSESVFGVSIGPKQP